MGTGPWDDSSDELGKLNGLINELQAELAHTERRGDNLEKQVEQLQQQVQQLKQQKEEISGFTNNNPALR